MWSVDCRRCDSWKHSRCVSKTIDEVNFMCKKCETPIIDKKQNEDNNMSNESDNHEDNIPEDNIL